MREPSVRRGYYVCAPSRGLWLRFDTEAEARAYFLYLVGHAGLWGRGSRRVEWGEISPCGFADLDDKEELYEKK